MSLLFDAHTHLHDSRLEGHRDALLAKAAAAGVGDCSCCGTAPADWEALTRLADRRGEPRIWPAFGVHPWFIEELPSDWLARLERLLIAHPEAAVGEIGIDGLRREFDSAQQRSIFLAQLALARKYRRTAVLHGARAWGKLLELLRPEAANLPIIVLHAFAGSLELLREFLALGAYISFVGSVCNPAARRVRAAAAATPLERLLVETDSPDLLPLGGQAYECGAAGQLNHPGNLPLMVGALAEIKALSFAEVATATAANARRLFTPQPH